MVVKPLLEQLRRSELLRPKQRVGQIKQEAERDGAGERIVEDHGTGPLQSIAGDGVAHRQGEKGEAEGQHDDVHHLDAPGEGRLHALHRA